LIQCFCSSENDVSRHDVLLLWVSRSQKFPIKLLVRSRPYKPNATLRFRAPLQTVQMMIFLCLGFESDFVYELHDGLECLWIIGAQTPFPFCMPKSRITTAGSELNATATLAYDARACSFSPALGLKLSE
jgi:hypothetical protein